MWVWAAFTPGSWVSITQNHLKLVISSGRLHQIYQREEKVHRRAKTQPLLLSMGPVE